MIYTDIASPPSYELWLTTDTGDRIAQLDNILSLQASRVLDKPGYFTINLPPSFDINLIAPDRMVQIWRQPRGGKLGLWQVYLIRRWQFSTSGSNQLIEIGGPDVLDLLRRRIVAAYATTAQASKSDFADDMIKEIVTESLADAVAPVPTAGTRVWANLTIAGDLGLGPSISDSFPFDKLLTNSGGGVLPGIAKASKEAGTEVFFDIVPNVVTGNSINFIFRTYTGQRGQDVSASVIFDQRRGNMINPSLEYDYTREENYIYATGQGERENRQVEQVSDATRYNQSIWGRIEAEADARQAVGDEVTAKGQTKLDAGKPRIHFTATPVDTQGTRFGFHWNFGDKVQARYLNNQFFSFINAVSISLDGDFNETINARLDYEAAI